MSDSANTFSSIKPIYKESYADKSKKKGKFSRLRKKLLNGWKPKKVGI